MMLKLKFIQAVIRGYLHRKIIKKATSKSLKYKEKNIPFVKGTLTAIQVM